MNLYRIVLASLLPFCQAWRVEVEPFENIPMYSKQNLTFKLEMENGITSYMYRVDQKKVCSQKSKIGHGGGFLEKKIHDQ